MNIVDTFKFHVEFDKNAEYDWAFRIHEGKKLLMTGIIRDMRERDVFTWLAIQSFLVEGEVEMTMMPLLESTKDYFNQIQTALGEAFDVDMAKFQWLYVDLTADPPHFEGEER